MGSQFLQGEHVTVNLHDVDDRFAALNGEVAVCTLCDLAATRTRAVPGEGSSSAEVMFIGEGPGQNEDKQGRPFVGAAGQFLNELISIIGLDRRQVYITNVVKCRPPQNRDPLPNELAACRPYLDRQIAMMNPRVIVTLGRYSLGTFFPGEFISRIHGSIRKIGSRYYYPMYHPASALYQQSNRQMIIDDMKKLGRWLEETSSQAELITPTERGPGPNEATEEEPSQLSLF